MDYLENKMLHLKPWHKSVSYRGKNLVVAIAENNARVAHKSRYVASADGFYAVYPEGWFFIALDEGGRTVAGWKHALLSLSEVNRIARSQGLFCREFSAEVEGNPVATFKYRTLFRQPWRIVTDLIVPDDDWGLVCDLPGWVYTISNEDEPSQMLAKALDHVA
ncbi:hypothetical protein [Yoonia sp. I 8.24]|uniref:hypothetical protein n=1 Tax=Yoonia sp. I 8.24 TaxID=1537229 RepID=UPI001EDD086E|nr:hypothetical protein [Yoonia sp. I 8.24]MCG3269325.1 hypothetical protein [Yoonia sp. I 8.24]